MEIISTSSAAVCATFFVAGEPGLASKVSSDMPLPRVYTSDAYRQFATLAAPTLLYLTDLNSASYVLKKPALITLRESDGEYILSFPDAEILTSGDTADEALSWMKDSIVTIYETLKSERALGPLPKRQLKALENYLGPKSTSKA
jgi:hypothetical protein